MLRGNSGGVFDRVAIRCSSTCGNHLTIRRDEVESRVLKALEERLLNQELFEEFCEEFTREMNRLRGEHRANLVAGEPELAKLKPDARS